MEFIYLIFTLARIFGFWMLRQTLARGVLCLLSAEYSVVMCEAWNRVCNTQGVTILGIEHWYDDLNNEPAVCIYTNLIPSGRY